MWSDWTEFAEALEGALGEEEQEAALQFAEESGLLDQWTAEEEAAQAGGYEQALEQEFQRVEAACGRKLTPDEEDVLLDSISTQERNEGVVPDFVADYAEPLANAHTSEQGRVHLGAAAAERVFDEQAEGRLARQAPPPGPEYDDTGYEEE